MNSERMVLWSGVVGGAGELLVRSVLVPDHEPDGWRVDIDPEIWRSMLAALRRQDQMLIAQVHSHPGEAYHSWGDDAFPAEHCDGFLSVVVPDFGRGVEEITDCAVFEYRLDNEDGSFIELDQRGLGDRIVTEQEVVRVVADGT
jgi:proteasome lid subunit RPN8/RPN11